jgi:hypothetical protein
VFLSRHDRIQARLVRQQGAADSKMPTGRVLACVRPINIDEASDGKSISKFILINFDESLSAIH